jgi:tetratricopeptide (TPR) repeat protein
MVENIKAQARAQESDYEWHKAIESYRKLLTLSLENKDFLEIGLVQEKIGYCLVRAAYLAENNEKYKETLKFAIDAYEKAGEYYSRSKDLMKDTRRNYCQAHVKNNYSRFLDDPLIINNQLDEYSRLLKEVIRSWELVEDKLQVGLANIDLIELLIRKIEYSWDWQDKRSLIEEAISVGEKSLKIFIDLDYKDKITQSYSLLYMATLFAIDVYQSSEKQKEIYQKMSEYSKETYNNAKLNDDLYYLGYSYGAKGWVSLNEGDYTSARTHFMKQLDIANHNKDNELIAYACSSLAYFFLWNTVVKEEEIEKRVKGFNDAIQHSEKAICHFRNVSVNVSPNAYMAYIDSYTYLANDETDLEEKRSLFEKGVAVGRKCLAQVRKYSLPFQTIYVLHSLCKALYYLSIFEPKLSEKRKLLEEVYNNRKELTKIWPRIQPFRYWNLGVNYNHLALITSELQKIETDEKKKRSLLQEAILAMENGIELCKKGAGPQESNYLAKVYNDYAGIITESYLFTNDKSEFEKILRIYQESIELYENENLLTRIAEINWKKGILHDRSGDFNEAANEFEIASTYYKQASDKMPTFKDFYIDYSKYMEGWSSIEKARYHHSSNKYNEEIECYLKSADLFDTTERWKYLSPNNHAWARLGKAEALSRADKTKEAKDAFNETADLFGKSKKSLEDEVEKIGDTDEREMVRELITVSDLRKEYCISRANLEEAKLLDRQGEYTRSSGKYASAAQKLQKIIDAMKKDEERGELKPILSLCKAWQKMTQAKAEASPDLYMEASLLFDDAKVNSVNEKTRLLSMGHANFCRALEIGTRYESERDKTTLQGLIQHLTGAATYYVRAGFQPALEYSKATQRLFEAYIYMDNAHSEIDPEQKARWFMMAERVLEASAESFSNALYHEKCTEILSMLENVKQERKLALSLSEVLHAPLISSTTTSFIAPTPSHEYPVGIESFEYADLQAKIFLNSEKFTSGEDFDIVIEIFNAGKAPASLVKINEIVPDDFVVSKVSGYYSFDEHSLDLKGRKIGPLNTVEISIHLKPFSKGEYILKPRIDYLDDSGEYKSCVPDPVNLTVSEMGILGWLRGSRPPR